jgi:UDP-N-acetylglucosamine 2-epimerase (non-hydrolysing)
MKKVLFIFGTRPEGIKLAPLIKKMQENSDFEVKVCITGQHREMLDQVMSFFEIIPDFDLKIMKPNQTLSDITSDILKNLQPIFTNESSPDYVVVQGDTTTAMVGALAGFYFHKKVVHIEAGLRSFDKYSPFPEEMNRLLVSKMADLHFAPTEIAKQNLLNEGVVEEKVFNVGNTVIDALFLGLKNLEKDSASTYNKGFDFIDPIKKIILVTAHRRENFGAPIEEVFDAVKQIALTRHDVQIIYPVHLNPNVQEPANRILKGIDNIFLLSPLDYPRLLLLMNQATIILTDSGGIQEESPSLGKPVLVLREVTERMEGVDAGTAKLVGTSKSRIIKEVNQLLDDSEYFKSVSSIANPYGDGNSCDRIIEQIRIYSS